MSDKLQFVEVIDKLKLTGQQGSISDKLQLDERSTN